MRNLNIRRSVFDSVCFGFMLCVLLSLVFQPTDEQMLRLGQNSLIFAGTLVFGAFLSQWLNFLRFKTLGELIFEPAYKKATANDVSWVRTFWGWQLLISFTVTLLVALYKTKFSMTELLDPDGFQGAVRLFTGIFNPNWDILPRAVLNIIETIFMAFLATTLAVPLAFLLSFACAKNIMKGPIGVTVYIVLRTTLNIARSVEALIWAIVFSVWVGIGPFAGMLALMIHSVASLAKQYSEFVEGISEGPIEGIQSTGATKLQTIWFAVVPQIVLPYISYTVYRWDTNVRMATIIGLVGGGGIGTLLIQYQGQAMWREVGCIIVVIAVVVWAMDTASAYIREALK